MLLTCPPVSTPTTSRRVHFASLLGETSYLCCDCVSLVSHFLSFSSCALPATPFARAINSTVPWKSVDCCSLKFLYLPGIFAGWSLQDGQEYPQPLPFQKPQESRELYWLEGWSTSGLWDGCTDFFSQVERGWPWLFILSQLLSPRLCQDISSGKPQLGAQMHFLCWLSERPILTGLVQGCCLSISNPSASSKDWVPWATWSGQLGGKGVTLETVSVTSLERILG